jgi:hypothetical protein
MPPRDPDRFYFGEREPMLDLDALDERNALDALQLPDEEEQTMFTRITCSWCHKPNVLTGIPQTCVSCGHRADTCRMLCDCPQCRPLDLDTVLMLGRHQREAVEVLDLDVLDALRADPDALTEDLPEALDERQGDDGSMLDLDALE